MALSFSVRAERRVRRSFSSTRKSTAGPTPASQKTNCPSWKFSGDPASHTKGSIRSAGKGGKLMYVLPANSAKSFPWA